MQNLIYYFNLINYALHKYLGVIFLERVADGILYICPKLEDFQKLHQPLPPEYRHIIESMKIENPQDLNVGDLIEEDKFPKGGIIFTFTAENKMAKDNIGILQKYYSSLHQEIQITQENPTSCAVKYSTFNALRFQINLIYLSVYQIK